MKVIFEAIIDPIILQEQGWKRKNERYISPSFEVMKDKGIPQVLSFILIENYDKIKGGLVPRLPAHYTIKFCLEEWISACKQFSPLTSEIVSLDDVSIFTFIDSKSPFFNHWIVFKSSTENSREDC